MAIVKMKRIRMLAARAQKDELLREMMLIGCVEVTEPSFDPQEVGLALPALGGPDSPDRIKTKIDRLSQALALLKKYAPHKTSFFSPLPELEWSKLEEEGRQESLQPLADEIISLDENIRAAVTEESQAKNTLTSLMPWAELDLLLELSETRLCSVMLGTLPTGASVEELSDSLYSSHGESQIFTISQDDDCYYLLVICMKPELLEVQDILRQYGFVFSGFHGMKGTPKENIEKYSLYIDELKKRQENLREQIAAYGDRREDLQRLADYYTTCMERAAAGANFCNTEYVVYFEGWVPVDGIDGLKERLSRFDCAWELEDPAPEEYPEVPVKLKNNIFSKPLNMVTDMYSLPAYNGVDPNPVMAPFFIFFYGMMMADMGYGLLMLIAAIVLITKKKPRGGMYDFSYLLLWCSFPTIVFGFLTGGFFGDFLTQIATIINPESTFELWHLFTPLEDTIAIMVGALALGVVQIITGMVISVVKKFKDGEVASAIADEFAWWFMLAGIALIACASFGLLGGSNIGIAVLCIGGALLLVGQFVIKKSVVGALVGVFAAIYNGVTGYFSDILSYSRLMALMLSGSIIATVFNTLGAVSGNMIVFIVVAMFGNALNFILAILSCFVHDLRLQCLEFFGRFYKDGGKAFKPLKINSKYYNVLKEEN